MTARAKDVAGVAADASQDQATRLAAIAVLGELPAKESLDALKSLEELDGAYAGAVAGAVNRRNVTRHAAYSTFTRGSITAYERSTSMFITYTRMVETSTMPIASV